MTNPGSDINASGQQPDPPAGNWAAPEQGATAAAKPEQKGAKKWLKAGVPVVVAVGLGAAALTGNFGIGDPEVGDCVKTTGATSFDVVDCGGDEAQFRISGVEKEEMTYPAFEEAAEVCMSFETAEMALWIGEETEKGTVYCAEPV